MNNPVILRLSLITLITYFTLSPLYSQQTGVGISLKGGLEAGWWIFDKGFDDTLPDWHQGYDRTHLAAILPIELDVACRGKAWFVELGVGIRSLRDNVMITSEDRRSNRERYRISEREAVEIIHVHARGGYNLLYFPNYSFTPTLTLGTFQIQTTHPQAELFKHKFYYEAGITNQFHFHRGFDMIIFPRYSNMIITTRPGAAEGSGHNIHSVGIILGVRYWII